MVFQVLTECPICCDFLQNVLETHCCHNLFCNQCLTDWRATQRTCPGCRANLDLERCHANIPIQRFVDGLPLDCPYKLSGCNAKVPRSEVERHKGLCAYHPDKIAEQKKKKT